VKLYFSSFIKLRARRKEEQTNFLKKTRILEGQEVEKVPKSFFLGVLICTTRETYQNQFLSCFFENQSEALLKIFEKIRISRN